MVSCIPSNEISGMVRYEQSGQWRTASEVGRDFWDYLAATYCLTIGNMRPRMGKKVI